MNAICDNCDVLVIGAGLTGLACANILKEAGIDTILLEAAERVGGRIHSVYDSDSNDYLADLGPTWIWPEYQLVIAQWLADLNIQTLDQYHSGKAVLDYGAAQSVRHQFLPAQDGMSRIAGGPQAIIDALQYNLPGNVIQYSSKVAAIVSKGSKLIAHMSGDNSGGVSANKILLCIPARIAATTINWPVDMGAGILKMLSEVPTWMATQTKAVILYEKPFWREMGLSGRVASQVGPLFEIHDHSQENATGALFGFADRHFASHLPGSDSMSAEIQKQLVRCFGEEAKHYLEIHIEDWANNFQICSPLDIAGEQSHPILQPNDLREPMLDGRLAFAISELATQSPGLIEGAFVSAMQATATILQS